MKTRPHRGDRSRHNEAGAIGDVVDASTPQVPVRRRRDRRRLPRHRRDRAGAWRGGGEPSYNIGIGAVQTRFKYALERGYETVRLVARRPARSASKAPRADRARRGRHRDGVAIRRRPASTAPLARRIGIIWFAGSSRCSRASECRYDFGLPGAQSRASRSSPATIPTTTPGRGDGARLQAPPPPGEVPVTMLSADGTVVDHPHPLDLLRAESDPRALRAMYAGTPCPTRRWRARLREDLDRSRRLAPSDSDRLGDPRRRLKGGMPYVARHGHRAPRAFGVAGRPRYDRRLARGRDLPAGDPVRRRDLVHHHLLLHYSTVLSQLDDQSTMLAQRLALLEQRLDHFANGTHDPRDGTS